MLVLCFHGNRNGQFLLALFKGNQQAAVEIPIMYTNKKEKTDNVKNQIKKTGCKEKPFI